MTKIYHVKFENQKYLGERTVVFSVLAKSITDAEKKGLKCLEKNTQIENPKHWKTESVIWADVLDK